MILLPKDVAHIWLLDFRAVQKAQPNTYWEVLSKAERERVEAFSNPQLRRHQLITRMAVRSALSQYSNSVKPGDWEFELSPKGKPNLKEGSPIPLSFNLSHSDDWLAIAITMETPIGVDLQRRGHQHALLELAERFFHPEEAKALAQLDEHSLGEEFFRFWTLKEAYLKARGLGIAAGLEKARFHLNNNGLITAELDPALGENRRLWQFHHFGLSDDYSLSLAMKQPSAQTAAPQFYQFLPGGPATPLRILGHEVEIR